MGGLNRDELRLLTTVVHKRKPCLQYLVDGISRGRLSPEEREALRSIIVEEFLDELNDDYEPNRRGIELDSLIGALTKVAPLQDRDIDEVLVNRILNCERVIN